MKNYFKNFFFFLILVFLGKVTGLFKDISLAYYLGANQITDAYFISVYVAGLFFAGVSFGIPLMIISDSSGRNNLKGAEIVAYSSLTILIVSITICIFLFIMSDYVAELFLSASNQNQNVETTSFFIRLSALTFPLSAMAIIAASIELFKGNKIPTNSIAVINNSAFIVAVFIWHEPHNFQNALYCSIASWAFMVIIYGKALLFIPKNLHLKKTRFFFNRFKRLIKVSKVFYLEQINPIISLYFIAKIGDGFVSIFSYSNKLFMLYITLSVLFINSYVVPNLAQHSTTPDGGNSRLNFYLTNLCYLIFPLVLFSLINSDLIVKLIYLRGAMELEDINKIVSLFQVFLLAIPCFLIKDIVSKQMLMNNNKIYIGSIHLLGILMNYLICYFFINNFNIYAVAVGYLISTLCVSLILLFYLSRESKIFSSIKQYFIGYVFVIFFIIINKFFLAYLNINEYFLIIFSFIILLFFWSITFNNDIKKITRKST